MRIVVPGDKLTLARSISSKSEDGFRALSASFGFDAVNFTSPWQAPQANSIVLHAVIDPNNEIRDPSRGNNSAERSVEVRAPIRPVYHVLFQRMRPQCPSSGFWPFCETVQFTQLADNNDFRAFAQDEWGRFLATWPIAATDDAARAEFRDAVLTYVRVDPTIQFYTQLMRQVTSPDDDAFDRIVYVLPTGLLGGDGLSNAANKKIVLVGETAASFTVAHEIGHTYGFREEYPAQDWWDTFVRTLGRTDCGLNPVQFPYGLVAGTGWDVLGGDKSIGLPARVSPFPTAASKAENFISFMGNTPRSWAPALDAVCNPYADLLKQLLKPAGGTAGSVISRRSAELATEEFAVFFVRGEATATSCTLDPAVRTTGTPSDPTEGTVEIRLLDASESTLSTLALGSLSGDVEVISFAASVPFSPNATRISLYRDGEECAALIRSAHEPVGSVSITQVVGNEIEASWVASDADGDPLEFSFSYSVDGRVWFPVLLNDRAPGNPLLISTGDLPGGDAVVRMVVSDGFNSTIAYSSTLAVGDKPPLVRIMSPSAGTMLSTNHPTNLYAMVIDPEDRLASVTWSDDTGAVLAEGAIGEGTPSRGARRILASARDQAGNVTTDSVDIGMTSDCPGDCDASGDVTVDEILTMVNIALGNTPLLDCEAADSNQDGQITVDEILTAVNNALNGCE